MQHQQLLSQCGTGSGADSPAEQQQQLPLIDLSPWVETQELNNAENGESPAKSQNAEGPAKKRNAEARARVVAAVGDACANTGFLIVTGLREFASARLQRHLGKHLGEHFWGSEIQRIRIHLAVFLLSQRAFPL